MTSLAKTYRRFRQFGSLLFIGALLSACSNNAPTQLTITGSDLGDVPRITAVNQQSLRIRAASADLPLPKQLETNANFWAHVFGVWDLPEVVFHDNRHLGVLYSKVILNRDGDGERYGDVNHAFLQAHLADLKQQLAILEQAVATGQSLTREQKALYKTIVDGAGKQALAGASERIRYQRGQKRRFARGLANEAKYLPLFKAIFRAQGAPENIAYLPHVESSFRTGLTSSAAATGMWQFTRGAQRRFMLTHPTIDERDDPVAAARGAARYMKGAYAKVGSWPVAVTSYNHGIQGMTNAVNLHGADVGVIHDHYRGRLFGFASRNFYPELVVVKYLSDNRETFFGKDTPTSAPLDLSALVLEQPAYPSRLSTFFGVSLTELAALNPAVHDDVWITDAALPAGMIFWLPGNATQKSSSVINARDTDKLAQKIVNALPPPQ